MEVENKRRIEFDTTGQFFGLGFAWSGFPNDEDKRFIAVIIGCLVIRINFHIALLPTHKKTE